MSNWTPAAILPNLRAKKALDGEAIALVQPSDQRVHDFCLAHPRFKELLSRFTDAFGVPLAPVSIIVRDDVIPRVSTIEPIASFRDLVAASVVPYCRALGTVYEQQIPRIYYSNSFWLYPWMLAKDDEYLISSTPALEGLHVVDCFQGQCDPEIPVRELNAFEIDKPLEALETRWRQHHLCAGVQRCLL
ncbi:MAG: hypothetical protein U0R19_02710 [Bryobacteraceae bacterium]